jgi:hypothetical protein
MACSPPLNILGFQLSFLSTKTDVKLLEFLVDEAKADPNLQDN